MMSFQKLSIERSLLLIIITLFCLSSCYRSSDDTTPKLNTVVQDNYLRQLPSAFPALSHQEKNTDWEREYRVGQGFARELDLYQAITAFKRASYLLSPENRPRKMELEYDILFCYFLGRKYQEALYTFQHSELRFADKNFPAYSDLILILYESYLQTDQPEMADKMTALLQQQDPVAAKTLDLSGTLMRGDLQTLRLQYSTTPVVATLLSRYDSQIKSPGTAQLLNTFIPGAGYLYIGQTQSAITAFLLNGLFLWATIHFFQRGDTAAGIITASFEAGWYFGGIYGAGQETQFYNQRIYEQVATPLMNENRLFPILMLHHAF